MLSNVIVDFFRHAYISQNLEVHLNSAKVRGLVETKGGNEKLVTMLRFVEAFTVDAIDIFHSIFKKWFHELYRTHKRFLKGKGKRMAM